jgi:type I restriction enzyme, S subunit
MMEVPPGWEARTLGDLGRYLNGRAFKSSEWSTTGRPIIRIQNLTGSGREFNYYEGEVADRYVVRHGDLLVSWAATLGAYFWDGPEGVLNQHIFKVESNIDKRFHKYLIESKVAEMMGQTHGSGMVHITKSKFDSIPVAVPPLDEQRRIVAILEDHLSRLDAASQALERNRQRLTAYRLNSIRRLLLGHETSETVRVELAGEGVDDSVVVPLPSGWQWRRLGDIAQVVGGVTKDAKKQSGPDLVEVPYLRVANVQRGRLDLSEVTTIRVPEAKADALRLRQGDVLLNEGGDRDKLGRGWVWEGQVEHCIHQNHVFRARVLRDSIDPVLLSWASNTIGGRWCELNGKQSVNLASISLNRIRLMPVPVPPRERQESIRQAVESVDVESRRLIDSLGSALAKAAILRIALLKAAFSGELTKESISV